ncbi:MAG: hypothetical protein U5L05_18435 [Rubrivivax sp.]|nr:hypothetical protein [Rubrivivax sp.]
MPKPLGMWASAAPRMTRWQAHSSGSNATCGCDGLREAEFDRERFGAEASPRGRGAPGSAGTVLMAAHKGNSGNSGFKGNKSSLPSKHLSWQWVAGTGSHKPLRLFALSRQHRASFTPFWRQVTSGMGSACELLQRGS